MFEVIINGKESEKYTKGIGGEGNRSFIDFKSSLELHTTEITRENVLSLVCAMTLSNPKNYTVDDLFDGNGDYFVFSRMENAEGDELIEDEDGWFVTYFVNVREVKPILATDIPEKFIPVRFKINGKLTKPYPNKNYKAEDIVILNDEVYSVSTVRKMSTQALELGDLSYYEVSVILAN